jgi:hypothetical protein
VPAQIADLDETRWTGRPGYPIRVMVGAALVKAVYAPPSAPLPGRQRRVIGVTWEEYQAQQQTETEQPPRVRDQRL